MTLIVCLSIRIVCNAINLNLKIIKHPGNLMIIYDIVILNVFIILSKGCGTANFGVIGILPTLFFNCFSRWPS